MAFYKDFEKKTRQDKREAAFARGGFDDEGTGYKNSKSRSSFGGKSNAKPAGKADYRGFTPSERTENGRKRYLDGKNGYGEHMPSNQKQQDKPSYEKSRYTPKKTEAPKKFEREEKKFDRYRDITPAAPVQYSNPLLDDDGDVVPMENLLSGRNPIREALKSGRDIEKLLVARGELSGSAREIVQMAKEKHIPVQEVDRERLSAITPNHQGMLAFASAYQYSTVEAMFDLAEERGEEPFLILLDGITDPHNLGAIVRTAECVGAHGVIIPERRAAGLTPTAAKAAAGALNHMKIARVTNINRTIDELKERGIWILGTSMDGQNAFTADLTGPMALVIGSEGDGISKLTLEKCDIKVTLPMKGHIESLNASVAAGVMMYEIARARSL